MPKPKSILQRVEVNKAERAHNCQHSKKHRLKRGDKRLRVYTDRSHDHYCMDCALKIIERDMRTLKALSDELSSESQC